MNDESEGAEERARKGSPVADANAQKKEGEATAVPKPLLVPQNLDSKKHKIVVLGSGMYVHLLLCGSIICCCWFPQNLSTARSIAAVYYYIHQALRVSFFFFSFFSLQLLYVFRLGRDDIHEEYRS